MNPKYSLFILLLLSSSYLYGQDTTARYPLYKYWAVKLPLLNFIDPNGPSFQVGIERRLNKYYGVQLMGGRSIYPGGSGVTGLRVKGEYRRYIKLRKKGEFYLAGELFYTQYTHATTQTFIKTIDSTKYEDNFTVHKNMYGLNVKCGFQLAFSKHWMFEVYSGIGIKRRIATQTGRIDPGDQPVRPIDVNLRQITNQAGDSYTISLPLNFSFGYIFR